jgi:hypothetical protein
LSGKQGSCDGAEGAGEKIWKQVLVACMEKVVKMVRADRKVEGC